MALVPAEYHFVDVPLNVILGQPVEDALFGALKLAVEALGGVVVNP